MYCTNCGAEVKDTTQNFCEKCGSSLPSSTEQIEKESEQKKATPSTTLGFEPYAHPDGLFDLNRNYYILKEKIKVIHF